MPGETRTREILPDFPEQRPIGLDRGSGITADERVYQAHVEAWSGTDNFFQMIDEDAAVFRVGIERVRVIAQARNGNALSANEVANTAGLVIV